MNAVYRLALVILMISAASLALAADPQPQSPGNPPASGELQPAPGLDINQAELEAGVTVDLVDPAKADSDADATSPMLIEIQAAMDQSRSEIAELAVRAAAAADHEAGLAIQREIASLKQQTELDILAIQARYARAGGNEELADQIDAAIAAIVSPPAPTAPAELRPAPSSQ